MRTVCTARIPGALVGLVLCSGGCGAAEAVWDRVRGLGSEAPAESALEPVEGLSTGSQRAAGATGGAAGASVGKGTGGPRATPPAASAEDDTAGSTTELPGGSTTLPMSVARPPAGSDAGDTGDTGDTGDGTGDSPGLGAETGAPPPTGSPPAGLPACVEGRWEIDDFSTYYRQVLRRQAHGRAVRHLSSSGRYTLIFDAAGVHGTAEHLRMRYSTQLADREVHYTIDIHGTFEATVRMDGTSRIRVEPAKGSTIRAREVARFEGGKSQTRRPRVPVGGLFEFDCGSKSLELRPVERGKTRDAIRFTRP